MIDTGYQTCVVFLTLDQNKTVSLDDVGLNFECPILYLNILDSWSLVMLIPTMGLTP